MVLLQTAPDGIEPDKVEKSIFESSPQVIGVNELKIWSLTARSNRIATCQLILDGKAIKSEAEVSRIITNAKQVLLEKNILCTTIEPLFRTA